MTWLWFTIAALATYYTALVIAEHDGPFGVFDRLRMRINSGYAGKGIRCIVCVSAYAGAFWALVLVLLNLVYDVWTWPVVAFGLAGASVLVNKVWKR